MSGATCASDASHACGAVGHLLRFAGEVEAAGIGWGLGLFANGALSQPSPAMRGRETSGATCASDASRACGAVGHLLRFAGEVDAAGIGWGLGLFANGAPTPALPRDAGDGDKWCDLRERCDPRA